MRWLFQDRAIQATNGFWLCVVFALLIFFVEGVKAAVDVVQFIW